MLYYAKGKVLSVFINHKKYFTVFICGHLWLIISVDIETEIASKGPAFLAKIITDAHFPKRRLRERNSSMMASTRSGVISGKK